MLASISVFKHRNKNLQNTLFLGRNFKLSVFNFLHV